MHRQVVLLLVLDQPVFVLSGTQTESDRATFRMNKKIPALAIWTPEASQLLELHD